MGINGDIFILDKLIIFVLVVFDMSWIDLLYTNSCLFLVNLIILWFVPMPRKVQNILYL